MGRWVMISFVYDVYSRIRKQGNVLLNDALNIFYLRLYGVGHMVKDQNIKKSKTTTTNIQTNKK